MRKGKSAFAGAVYVAAVGLAGGSALATPGAGATASIIGSRTAVDKVTRGSQPSDAVVRSITSAPGGRTGWRTHARIAAAVVSSRTLTIYDAKDRTRSPPAT